MTTNPNIERLIEKVRLRILERHVKIESTMHVEKRLDGVNVLSDHLYSLWGNDKFKTLYSVTWFLESTVSSPDVEGHFVYKLYDLMMDLPDSDGKSFLQRVKGKVERCRYDLMFSEIGKHFDNGDPTVINILVWSAMELKNREKAEVFYEYVEAVSQKEDVREALVRKLAQQSGQFQTKALRHIDKHLDAVLESRAQSQK